MKTRAEFRKHLESLDVEELNRVGTELGHTGAALETFTRTAKRLMAQAWTSVLVGYVASKKQPRGGVPMTQFYSLPSKADMTGDVSSIAKGEFKGMYWEEILEHMFQNEHLEIPEDEVGVVWVSFLEALHTQSINLNEGLADQFTGPEGWVLFSELGTDYGIRLLENLGEQFFWRESPQIKLLPCS